MSCVLMKHTLHMLVHHTRCMSSLEVSTGLSFLLVINELPVKHGTEGLEATLGAMLALVLRARLPAGLLLAEPARLLSLLWLLEAWDRCAWTLMLESNIKVAKYLGPACCLCVPLTCFFGMGHAQSASGEGGQARTCLNTPPACMSCSVCDVILQRE